jgi:hypothetical protein
MNIDTEFNVGDSVCVLSKWRQYLSFHYKQNYY